MKSVKTAIHRLTGTAGVNYRLERAHEALRESLADLGRQIEQRVGELHSAFDAALTNRVSEIEAAAATEFATQASEIRDAVLQHFTSIERRLGELQAAIDASVTTRIDGLRNEMLRQSAAVEWRIGEVQSAIDASLAVRIDEISTGGDKKSDQQTSDLRDAIRRQSEAVERRIGEVQSAIDASLSARVGEIRTGGDKRSDQQTSDIRDAIRRQSEVVERQISELQATLNSDGMQAGRDLLARHIELTEEVKSLRTAEKSLAHMRPYFGTRAPLFLDRDGSLALQLKRGITPERVFVSTVPKSGTYLIAAVLESIGVISCGCHFAADAFSDYRNRTIREMVENYLQFTVMLPLNLAADLVKAGQFAVGHVEPTEGNRRTLAPFKMVFAKRELRGCLVSMMRWLMNNGRGEQFGTAWKGIKNPRARMEAFLRIAGEEQIRYFGSFAGWAAGDNGEDRDLLVVRFETLVGDDGRQRQLQSVRQIAAHAGVALPQKAERVVLDSALGRPTKTWSGGRTEVGKYWTEECEAIFRQHGGPEINRLLGYETTAARRTARSARPAKPLRAK